MIPGEASAVAVNSKGHIFLFQRTKPMLTEYDAQGKSSASESQPRPPSALETRARCAFRGSSGGSFQQIPLLIMCIELHLQPRRSPLLSPLTPKGFNTFPLFCWLEDQLHFLTVPAVAGQTGVAFDDFIG
jgi:hypothetical protein